MVWNAARGGMRSVVEGYRDAGFLEQEDIHLIAAYADVPFWRRQLLCLSALLTFMFQLCRHRVELVHLHAATRGSFWRKALFASIARLFGVPVILHLHGAEFRTFYVRQPAPIQWLIRRQLERANRVIVLSETWRSHIAAIAPLAHIAVVPNAVPLPAKTAIDAARPNILFLGRIGSRKGAFELIAAFTHIAERYPDARLTLAGDGDTTTARQLAATLNLSHRITVRDWVDAETRATLLAQASIYALPSHNEGLPMSVLESMAAGVAVVTTPVGGIPDLITSGQQGVLVPPGDVTALVDALTDLLDAPQRRAELATAGRHRIATAFTPEVILPRLSALYADCARQSHTAPCHQPAAD